MYLTARVSDPEVTLTTAFVCVLACKVLLKLADDGLFTGTFQLTFANEDSECMGPFLCTID